MLAEKFVRISEVFHFDDFEFRDGQLYHKDKSRSLMYGKEYLRTFKEIKKILGEGRICDLCFEVPKDEVTAEQAVKLNEVEEELLSVSDVAKADDIELQEITESTTKSMENLITQFEGEEMLPM